MYELQRFKVIAKTNAVFLWATVQDISKFFDATSFRGRLIGLGVHDGRWLSSKPTDAARPVMAAADKLLSVSEFTRVNVALDRDHRLCNVWHFSVAVCSHRN